LKRLGVHSEKLTRIDDAGKLGLIPGPPMDPHYGLALHRIEKDRPIVTFDIGRPPAVNACGLSGDGRFAVWGRRDGTVCVADVNRCLEQLTAFGKR
jgi:hypothetical protein